MSPPATKPTADDETVLDSRVIENTTQEEVEDVAEPQQEISVTGAVEEAGPATVMTKSTEAPAEESVTEETVAPRPRKRKTLPWNAVNRSQEVEEEVTAPPAKKTRKPPKPRGKKKAATAGDAQETEQQDGAEKDDTPPVRKRLSAKARGKRRADAPDVEDGEEASAPAKRARRSRKVKSKATVVDSDAEEEAPEEQTEGGEVVVRRKPRKPRQKKRTAPEGDVEEGEEGSQPKRKGRPPREPTPSDAEDNEIDPEVTFMDSLASRNIRVGRLSAREKAMREIDWVAVRQRQREEDSRPFITKEAREKAERLQNEQAPQTDGPRYRVAADGSSIEIIHDSMIINPDADTERQVEAMEIREEENLTTRITSRSFLKNNKRFPNDFILPGQGRRWTVDDTTLFYQGLRNFGTDFQMISHMFPGSSRRSIKLKFTREERDDPEAVREALLGRSTIVSEWDNFVQVSQMDEERFADTDRIKREMAEVEAEWRAKIVAAKAEADERKRQQEAAGFLNDEGEGGEKENGIVKGKKRRKGKEKQVTFQEEAGVEVLGGIDDDADWGKE